MEKLKKPSCVLLVMFVPPPPPLRGRRLVNRRSGEIFLLRPRDVFHARTMRDETASYHALPSSVLKSDASLVVYFRRRDTADDFSLLRRFVIEVLTPYSYFVVQICWTVFSRSSKRKFVHSWHLLQKGRFVFSIRCFVGYSGMCCS